MKKPPLSNPLPETPSEPEGELRTCFSVQPFDGLVEVGFHILLMGGGRGELRMLLRLDEAMELQTMLGRAACGAMGEIEGMGRLLKKTEGGFHGSID